MCVHCETYDFSANCGERCEDHEWVVDEVLTDEDGVFLRCPRCGNCKPQEATDVAA